ncbi:TolC family protein [bacterium]|nr:TolC family protein [bacterium]
MKCRYYPLAVLLLVISVMPRSLAQERRVLSFEEAVDIALNQSYTVKSYLEEKNAMQFYFNYYKAMFKPRMDLSLFTPGWNESVIPVQRADGLPVYNSFGSMQLGGDLKFTYILPTGGNFALRSLMYRDNQTTTLPQQNYAQLKTDQAYSSLSLSFTQPIFTRNTLRENLNEAKYELERTTSVFTRQQMNIIYNVTVAYYNLYRLTRNVEIAEERLKNSEEALRIARLKAETGRIPLGDVLISEVDAATNRGNLSEAVGTLQRNEDDFKQLIGLDLDEEFQILTDLQYDTFAVDRDKAVAEALAHRLEINESELNIKLQQIRLDRAKRVRELSGAISAYYDITGVSTIGTGTTQELFQSSFDNFVDRPPNRGVTLTLSYPIFDWGRGSSRVQQERANLRRSELDLENLEVTIIKEVRDVVRSIDEAKNRLRILEQNQRVSERSYEISRVRFENGDISSQELSREQERLAQSQLDYLNAFITYQMTVAELKRTTLWDFKNDRSYLRENYFSD